MLLNKESFMEEGKVCCIASEGANKKIYFNNAQQ